MNSGYFQNVILIYPNQFNQGQGQDVTHLLYASGQHCAAEGRHSDRFVCWRTFLVFPVDRISTAANVQAQDPVCEKRSHFWEMQTIFILKTAGAVPSNNSPFNPKRFFISSVVLLCNNKSNPNQEVQVVVEIKGGKIKTCSLIASRVRNNYMKSVQNQTMISLLTACLYREQVERD